MSLEELEEFEVDNWLYANNYWQFFFKRAGERANCTVEAQCIGLEKLFWLPTDPMLANFWHEKHKFKLKGPW